MAPEQALGKRGLTTGVDIYSLGVVLYELLTGRPPFNGNTPVETLWQVVHQEPERPRFYSSAVDPDLETICLKCLEKAPERRYGSAEALAADLEHWCQGLPITARRVSRLERIWRWGRRNPLLACLVAALTSLLFVEAVVSTAGLLRIHSTRTHVENALEKLRDDYQTELREREKAQVQAYGASIGLAHRYLAENRRQAALEMLQQCPASLHNWEWHYLMRQCTATGQFTSPVSADVQPPIQESTRRQAVLEGRLIKLPRVGRPMEPLVLEGHTGTVTSVAFTPDGQRLASVAGDGTVRLWHTGTGQELLVFAAGEDCVGAAAFSLDGQRLMLVHPVSRKVLRYWEAAPLGR
jgi:hypothetical protein